MPDCKADLGKEGVSDQDREEGDMGSLSQKPGSPSKPTQGHIWTRTGFCSTEGPRDPCIPSTPSLTVASPASELPPPPQWPSAQTLCP